MWFAVRGDRARGEFRTRREGGAAKGLRVFLNIVAEACGKIVKFLRFAGWPHDINSACGLTLAEAKMQRLRVLRKIARARGYEFHAAVHVYTCADCVAIRFDAAQPERDRLARSAAVVLEDANLRAQPALEYEIQIAVAIEIGHGECAAIIREVEAAYAGEVIVAAAAPDVEDIRLASRLAVLFVNGVAERIPPVLVGAALVAPPRLYAKRNSLDRWWMN